MSIRLAPTLSDPPAPRPSARVGTIAAMLDCDQSQIRRLVSDGALQAFTIGKRGIRIYLDSVAAYQERQARAAGAPTSKPRKGGTDRRQASTAAHNAAEAQLRAAGFL